MMQSLLQRVFHSGCMPRQRMEYIPRARQDVADRRGRKQRNRRKIGGEAIANSIRSVAGAWSVSGILTPLFSVKEF